MANATLPKTDMDQFILEKLVPFRKQILETLKQQHPYMLSILENVMRGKKSKVGFRVWENGNVAGMYTFELDGIHIVATETGKMYSEIHHPFLGVIKPYAEIERDALERMVGDEQFTREPLSAVTKYLPNVTIKFFSVEPGDNM